MHDSAMNIYFISVLATRKHFLCNYNSAMKTFFSIQLGPPGHRSLSNVTVAVLSFNITLGQNYAPHIYSKQCANKGLVCVEISPNCVLVLSDDHSTSVMNNGSLLKVCTTGNKNAVFVELIISVFVAPCEADVVKLSAFMAEPSQ